MTRHTREDGTRSDLYEHRLEEGKEKGDLCFSKSLFSPRKHSSIQNYAFIEEIWDSFDEFQFGFHRVQLSIFHFKYTLNVYVSTQDVKPVRKGSKLNLRDLT